MTREELEEGRRERDENLHVVRIYGYKRSYCSLIGCCEECDKRIRFGCKIIHKIEDIQTKRILKICSSNSEYKEGGAE